MGSTFFKGEPFRKTFKNFEAIELALTKNS
ncbi:hypothetical protein SAMN05444280_13115 [Tangfeifania diversioriginum]|uniref:Uncharacterized protein n=1 Tax=Tangfeifania diversioriginum TaxID=1168035 RepID=A0A1M6M930_9BACT|nr:hypothetical protein SAMN05444280_13115 [Tangfeifania diversioriginum]